MVANKSPPVYLKLSEYAVNFIELTKRLKFKGEINYGKESYINN